MSTPPNPLVQRLRRAMVMANKQVLQALRSEESSKILDMPVSYEGFATLEGHKHCLVVTYRKDGRPVAQPVWPGHENGRLFVWTESGAFKAKRVAKDPRALIAPCTFRGIPLGAPVAATGRILPEGDESKHAERVIRSGWGWKRKAFELTSRPLTGVIYLEFIPAEQPAPLAGALRVGPPR
jgi:PPOX class probable F420-dependent enzyme